MKKFFKKALIYSIMTMLVFPASVMTMIMGAQHAMAAGLDTQDFGVMQSSGVNGYSVGFGLLGMTASDLKTVKVELFKDSTLLSTSNALIPSANWTGIASATSLSAPFNINGYFDYAADGYWSNNGWNGTVEDVPTSATVSIVDNSDKVFTGDYSAPTGDPTLLKAHDYIGADALTVVHPEDFGTMRASGVSGYTVGFGTAPYEASHFKKIEVKLYEGANLLATATSSQAMTQYPTATSLSAPFDVNGTFDYVADTSWTYSGWNGTLANIPTRAVIKVTDKMDNTYTVENHVLTGTPLPYMVAEDFGVMQISGVNGYTVGFGLNGITAADVASAKVELFKNTTLLSTSNGVMPAINALDTATSLSSPFNIDGTFDYVLDGYWSNTGWNGSLSDVPTKAVITLVDSLGARYTAENTNLTGDPTTLLPTDESQNPVIVKVAQGTGKSILIDFNGSGVGVSEYIVSIDGVNVWTVSNTIGNDVANVYHFSTTVLAYRTYAVKVVAYNYGVKVGEAVANVEVKAPVIPAPPAPSNLIPTTTTSPTPAPQKAQAAVNPQPVDNTVQTPSDSDGVIKGDEQTADNASATNWTPWIILFILIVLAGAATGGYFYWFAGKEEDDKNSKAIKSKAEVSEKVSATVKSKDNKPSKKSKRW